jgi:ankyrin repeat protein
MRLNNRAQARSLTLLACVQNLISAVVHATLIVDWHILAQGETPLFTAAANGSILHVELLLAAGADIESAVDRHGFTALMTASELGHEKVVETLLAAGADVNRCNKSASISPAHQTAIYIAAREGHDHCLQVLLAAPGADVNSRTVNSRSQEQGHSALTASALNGHILCVERLLAAGAEIDAPGLKGLPAVSWAVFSRHIDVVRLLIGRHANVNTKVTEGAFKQGTPLTLAIEWSRDCTVEAEAGSVVLEIVKELLGAGAAVNAPGIEGNTPLMLATKTGNLAIVGELLSMGADVNLHNLHHETALHMAAKGETDGHVSCAKRLIASNASVSKKNAKGKTPLAVAKESTSKQKAAMQDLLLEAASSGEN